MIKQENVRAIILFVFLVYGSITSSNQEYLLLTQLFPLLNGFMIEHQGIYFVSICAAVILNLILFFLFMYFLIKIFSGDNRKEVDKEVQRIVSNKILGENKESHTKLSKEEEAHVFIKANNRIFLTRIWIFACASLTSIIEIDRLFKLFPFLPNNLLINISSSILFVFINAICIYGILRLPALITKILNSFMKNKTKNG